MATRNYELLKKFPTDVMIRTQGHDFPAHKTILSIGSSYFETIFLGSFSKDTVELPDIPSESFQLILDILYEDKFPELETAEDYRTLKQYLDYFGIETYSPFLLCVCKYSNSILLELLDEIPRYEIPDLSGLSGPIPQDLILELYRRKYLSTDELLQKSEQIENPLDTVFKLRKLGLDESTMTRMASSLKIMKDLARFIEEAGEGPVPTELLRVLAMEEEMKEYSRWREIWA